MQVFLPHPDFRQSLECLDNVRLRNQILRECKTLISGGWSNHPAAKMWLGYEHALCEYAIVGLEVIRLRGYPRIKLAWMPFWTKKQKTFKDTGMPPFVGNEEFHASHRSNLLRKDPEWYGKFGWTEPDDLEYIWPI